MNIVSLLILAGNRSRRMIRTYSTYIPEVDVHSNDNWYSEYDNNASTDPDRFECDQCGRSYKLEKYLRHHQRWECGMEPSYFCSFCSFRSKRKEGLKRHLERRHPSSF